MGRQAHQSSCDQNFWKKSYDYKKFEPKLLKAAQSGTIMTNIVIAGICEVGQASVYRWTDAKSGHYKPRFHRLVEQVKAISAATIANKNTQAIAGDLKDTQALKRQYNDQLFSVAKTTKHMTLEERLDHYLQAVESGDMKASTFQKIFSAMPNQEANILFNKIREALGAEVEEDEE